MSTIESRWTADRRELERTTSARSLFGPAANYMSASTDILLTSVFLVAAIAVIGFGAPLLPATVGAIGTSLIRFASDCAVPRRARQVGSIVTHVSRLGGRESGIAPESVGGR